MSGKAFATQEEIKNFLTTEFEKAWDMIFLIDNRRFKIIQYYSFIVVGVLTLATKFIIDQRPGNGGDAGIELFLYLLITILLLVTIAIGLTFRKVLQSERDANVRYRKKINLIRGLFLLDSESDQIAEYLKHPEWGIKTARDEQPSGMGTTLKGVYHFISIGIFLTIIFIFFIWINYFWNHYHG